MSRRNLSQIGIPIALLLGELFQGFSTEFTKISKLHSSTLYNIQTEMSREKNLYRCWGVILKKFRQEAHLTQGQLAKEMGYPKGKGKISEIEAGKLPITEENIRMWVLTCGKRMIDFYAEILRFETATDLIQPFVSSKKSE